MRYLLSLLLLLPGPVIFAQDKPTITVLLYPAVSRPGMFVMADSVQFFRLPEDQPVLTPDLKHWRALPVPLNIYPGDYRIAYRNMFGQTANKNCRLYQDSVRIDLHPDSLTSYPDNTLARLQDKDSLVIDFHSIGCFSANMGGLVIRCRGGLLEAEAEHGEKKILTTADVLQFVRFENELQHIQDYHCSIIDYYAIKSKYLTLNKTVRDCDWGGFLALTAAWFDK